MPVKIIIKMRKIGVTLRQDYGNGLILPFSL